MGIKDWVSNWRQPEPDPHDAMNKSIGDLLRVATEIEASDAYDKGAAVAFGLMGMAEAIRRRPRRATTYCVDPDCWLDSDHEGDCMANPERGS